MVVQRSYGSTNGFASWKQHPSILSVQQYLLTRTCAICWRRTRDELGKPEVSWVRCTGSPGHTRRVSTRESHPLVLRAWVSLTITPLIIPCAIAFMPSLIATQGKGRRSWEMTQRKQYSVLAQLGYQCLECHTQRFVICELVLSSSPLHRHHNPVLRLWTARRAGKWRRPPMKTRPTHAFV